MIKIDYQKDMEKLPQESSQESLESHLLEDQYQFLAQTREEMGVLKHNARLSLEKASEQDPKIADKLQKKLRDELNIARRNLKDAETAGDENKQRFARDKIQAIRGTYELLEEIKE